MWCLTIRKPLRLWAAMLAFVCAISANGLAKADDLTVFAAASLTELVDVLAKDFGAQSGHVVRVVTAASSTLARQIEKGAPADVFISANKEWADYVTKAREFSAPVALFGNSLVVVSPLVFRSQPRFEDLPKLVGDGRLAIGDPAHVPAGEYAQEALKAAGIWDELKDKLAPASDVRGALAFVTSGATKYAIVYATDAQDVVPATIVIDPKLYTPIAYYAVRPKTGSLALDDFMDYLEGAGAAEIFKDMGFVPLGGDRP